MHRPADCAYYSQHGKPTKSQQKANIGIGWNRMYKALFRLVFNGWFKFSNICGGTQVLEMFIFMDILDISEPILIKQRLFCNLNCMFFRI